MVSGEKEIKKKEVEETLKRIAKAEEDGNKDAIIWLRGYLGMIEKKEIIVI